MKIKNVIRWIWEIIGVLLILLLILIILLNVPQFQDFGRHMGVRYLNKKLGTTVELKGLAMKFPTSITLDSLYLEDQSGDTLLFSDHLYVGIEMMGLLSGKVHIDSLRLHNLYANANRTLEDTTFNFDYITQAFSSGKEKKKKKKKSSSPDINIKDIHLSKIRVNFDDVVSGYHANIRIQDFITHVDSIYPDRVSYGVDSLRMRNSILSVIKDPPLSMPEKEKVEVEEKTSSVMPSFAINKFSLDHVLLNYRDREKDQILLGDIDSLILLADKMDLPHQEIRLKKILLNESNLAFYQNSPAVDPAAAEPSDSTEGSSGNWRISLDSLILSENQLVYDDKGKTRQPDGIDYNHLNVGDFNLLASDLFYTNDSSSLALNTLTLREQSGFYLKQLQSRVRFTDTFASLDDFTLQTEHTRLSDLIVISYPSLDSLSTAPEKIGVQIRLDSGEVDLKDLFYFQPELAKDPYLAGLAKNPVFLNTSIGGSLGDLVVDSLLLEAGTQTKVSLAGILKNITDPEQAYFDLQMDQLSSGRADVYALLPPQSRPKDIEIPGRFSLKGNFKGLLQAFTSDLNLTSTDGNAVLRADVKNITDTVRAQYDVNLALRRIRMDRILKNDTLYGPLSMDMKVKGRGLTPRTMATALNGEIREFGYRQYDYRNIRIGGEIQNKTGNLKIESNDPNVLFNLAAQGNFESRYPAVQLLLGIENLELDKLNLREDSLKIKGELEADFAQLDLDDPIGQMSFQGWEFVTDSQQITLDTVRLAASSEDSEHVVTLTGPLADAKVTGDYKASEVGALIKNIKDKYLLTDSLPEEGGDSLSSWRLKADVAVKKSPLWNQFLPDLKQFNGGDISLKLSSNPDSMLTTLSFSTFNYKDITVDSVRFAMTPFKKKIRYILAGEGMESSFIDVPRLFLRGGIDENGMTANLTTLDSNRQELYHLIGNLKKEENGLTFNILSDTLLLNNQKWEIPDDNYIGFSPENIEIHHFKLQNGEEYLSLGTDSTSAENKVEVDFNKFKVSNITALFLKDSLQFDGNINGKAMLYNPTTDLSFTSDLSVDDIVFHQNNIGKLSLLVDSKEKDEYDLKMQLVGDENEALINGTYSESDSRIQAKMDLKSLSMKTIEAFSMGQMKEATGRIEGSMDITGQPSEPHLNGDLYFKDVSLILTKLNNYFALKNEQLSFDGTGLHFKEFTLLDSAENKAVLNGDLLTKDYRHFKFDMRLDADHYQVLNKPEDKSEAFYGSLIFSTNARIRGDEALPVVDADLRLDKGTDFTLALLESTPEEVSSEGVVEFVNPNEETDSIEVESDSLNTFDVLRGIDLSADISVDSSAMLNLIVDPLSGDKLSVRGKANLNYTISPGGESDLTGRFDILSGAYKMSFEKLIKRDFNIQRGSYINWEGDPLQAKMHITARYDVKAPAIDLVENQSSSGSSNQAYKQKLPFQVFLHMEGELMSPEINFELGMPEESRNAFDGSVYTRINQVNSVPSEVNKQTLGLLVFGHFIQDNPFESGGGGGTEQMVRESVSKILSQQLNNLAGSLIKGVDLNFDLESKQDYSSGDPENQTNLNVGVSKSLFNDRTTIYIGGDIPLEGNDTRDEASYKDIVGDMAIEYKLSKDGRYRLKAYRENKYEGVIEGEFIESGLSFIIFMDYDKFRELFQRSDEQ